MSEVELDAAMQRLVGIYFLKSYFIMDDGKIRQNTDEDESYLLNNEFILEVTEETKNNGYDYHKEIVAEHLEIGKEYTLLKMDVGGWSSSLTLKEFPKIQFNSVSFKLKDVRPIKHKRPLD